MTENKWLDKDKEKTFLQLFTEQIIESFFERIKVVLLMSKNKPWSKIKGTSLLRKYFLKQ